MKVVVDCGNGTAASWPWTCCARTGAEVIPLYCESDGTFPNHHPDPTVDEYIQDMIARVREEKADLGVGFDGDADRIGRGGRERRHRARRHPAAAVRAGRAWSGWARRRRWSST
jgi:phosphomannomutase